MTSSFSIHGSFSKTDDDQMLAFGWASVSIKSDGEIVVDSHNDTIPPDVLERASYEYALHSRQGHVQHGKKQVARLVEIFASTPTKLKAMGLKEDALPQGIWCGFKVDDPKVWKAIKSGDLPSFSIAGTAKRREVR